MPRRGTQLVILCEDLQQEVFTRHLFLQCGFHRREIRVKRSPTGKGAGEQYVRKNYPREVKAYRRQSSYRSVCLAVMIDADTYTVVQRLNQLDSALESDTQQKREANEKISIFVPKRNIETWIYYLMGNVVDEETVYPKFPRKSDCKPCVEKLVTEVCPSEPQADSPPPLHLACDELQRIL